jgi:hypothetical protein
MTVTVEVPEGMRFQYVYRLDRPSSAAPTLPAEFQYHYLDSVGSAVRSLGLLRRQYGTKGAAQAVAKIGTGKRSLYLITRDGAIVSDGWCTLGQCKYYHVEANAVVIGPIWTSPDVRGNGLASIALQMAIGEFTRRNKGPFYIDTSNANLSAQRVFQKSGFGPPVALYLRTISTL